MSKIKGLNPYPIPITFLELRGVYNAVRALILDLRILWLKASPIVSVLPLLCLILFSKKLSYLTHTSVQVYSKERWNVVLKVPKKVNVWSCFPSRNNENMRTDLFLCLSTKGSQWALQSSVLASLWLFFLWISYFR
jgi:hypothetical protein